MQQAIDLALQGRGEVEPNPRVGAVVLEGDEIVGRGWHRFYGGPHAEVEALTAARERGGVPDTLVVTLEPCSASKGEGGKKNPPCTEAIVEGGIRRVVVGMADPDPRHQGKGLAVLRDAGVEVREGVLASACQEINAPFFRWLSLDRPWTLAKYAMTLDGKTAAPSGESRWISGPESRRKVHQLRSRMDAVVVGYRTAKIDNPQLTVRDVEGAQVEGAQPVRVVVDPLAGIDDDSRLVASAGESPVWLLVGSRADAAHTGRLRDLGVEVIQVESVGEHRLDLGEAWRELRRRGLRRLMVEGGGRLLAELLQYGCVDQVLAFVAPMVMGGEGAPTPVAGEGKPSVAEAWGLAEVYSYGCGDDLVVGGFVRTNDGVNRPG